MGNKRVGLLVGRERSFPDALIAEVNRRGQGVDVAAPIATATVIAAVSTGSGR